jgi:hypothetical protein
MNAGRGKAVRNRAFRVALRARAPKWRAAGGGSGSGARIFIIFQILTGGARRLSETFLGGFERFQGLAGSPPGAPALNALEFCESGLKMAVNRKISMARSLCLKNGKCKLPFASMLALGRVLAMSCRPRVEISKCARAHEPLTSAS